MISTSQIRAFLRACIQLTGQGVLKLNATQCCQLLEECLLMAHYADDKSAIMDICYTTNKLGLMSKEKGLVSEQNACFMDAVNYQKLSLRSATVIGDPQAIMASYGDLGNAYMFNRQLEDARHCTEKALEMAAKDGNKEAEALCLKNLGALLNDYLGEHDEAIECFKKSLILAKEVQSLHTQTLAHRNLAVAYKGKKEMDEAIKCYQECLKISPEQDIKDTFEDYENIGNCYLYLKKPDKALEYFKKSLNVARMIKDLKYLRSVYLNMAKANDGMKSNDETINCCLEYLKMAPENGDPEKFTVYQNLARVYNTTGNPKKAMSYFEKSRELAIQLGDKNMELKASTGLGKAYLSQGKLQEALELSINDLQLARELGAEESILANLAALHERLGNYTKAIEYSEEALHISEKKGDKTIQSAACGTLGNIYGNQGDYHKANEYHNRQLEICTAITFFEGQRNACNSLGTNYKNLGNYYEAIKWHEKTLEICIDIGDVRGEAVAFANLAVLYELLRQYNKAMEYHTKVIENSRKINDRSLEGVSILNLANTQFRIGKYKEAEASLEEALAIAVEVGNKSNEAKAYLNLAMCKIEFGHDKEALQFLDKQTRLCEEMQDKSSLSRTFEAKGSLYKNKGDLKQAIFCYEKALQIDQENGDKRGEALHHGHLGAIYVQQSLQHDIGKKEFHELNEAAINSLRKSLECWEWIFEHIQEQDNFKVSILDSFIANYKILSLCLIMAGSGNEALLISERGRARALDDLLTSKYNIESNQFTGSSLSIQDVETMAKTVSIVFYNIVNDYWLTWTAQEDDINVRIDQQSDTDFNDIVNRVYSVIVRQVECEDRLIQTEDEQPTLSNKVDIPINVPDNLLLSIKKRNVPDYDDDDDENSSNPLESLYNKLISQVSRDLIHDELVIIPDEDLFKVPFAALIDPNTGMYLSETKRIRIAPSLTALKALQECPADYHSKSGALVIGNPHVGEVMFRGKKQTISSLPGAQEEARKIGHVLGVTPFLGAQATKEDIIKHLKDVAVIHVAAHGTKDGEIFLGPGPLTGRDTPEEQEYLLTIKDVQESGVCPQLVVLSCCHSGGGEVKAEGVVGMSRAFLASGARAVLASLWAIADQATMVFMGYFYKHLKEGKSASTSLQQAMKDMRETSKYSEPMFWAPFFLIGDDVTVEL